MPRRKRTVTENGRLGDGAGMRSEEDVLGSYTGVPAEGGVPEQDADGL